MRRASHYFRRSLACHIAGRSRRRGKNNTRDDKKSNRVDGGDIICKNVPAESRRVRSDVPQFVLQYIRGARTTTVFRNRSRTNNMLQKFAFARQRIFAFDQMPLFILTKRTSNTNAIRNGNVNCLRLTSVRSRCSLFAAAQRTMYSDLEKQTLRRHYPARIYKAPPYTEKMRKFNDRTGLFCKNYRNRAPLAFMAQDSHVSNPRVSCDLAAHRLEVTGMCARGLYTSFSQISHAKATARMRK